MSQRTGRSWKPIGIRRASGFLACCLASLLSPEPLAAQVDAVGRIDRIRVGVAGSGSAAERTCGPTPDVGVLRRSSSVWQDGRCDLTVLRADRIRVRPRTVVRLKLRGSEGEGDVTLSPDSLFSEIGGEAEGIYEIRETPQLVTGWELVVTRGSLALHWVRGRLLLFNSGTRAVVSGTRLVISSTPDQEAGILHLIEGSVSFPDFPDVTLRAGEWARLRAGVAPEVTAAAPPVAQRFQRTVAWAVDDAWGRSFLKSPWLYAGIAAVGAVTAWQLYGREDDQRRGSVILRIP